MAIIDPNTSAATPSSPTPRQDISLDILVPLTTLLPPLCCAHPDPPTRHLTFRLLHLVLDATPPALRLQILKDLLEPSEEAFPQMRSAAIGLVKTSFLRALQAKANVAAGTDVFLSPILLKTVGRYVFRADPPDLFGNELEVDAFLESTEPARLVECLGLYYVLVLRDADNMVCPVFSSAQACYVLNNSVYFTTDWDPGSRLDRQYREVVLRSLAFHFDSLVGGPNHCCRYDRFFLLICFANCSYLGMAQTRTKVSHLRHFKPMLRGLTKH